ncbi:MAG: glycosyltransferase family 2 protein [Ignavibacteriae bacterium]|nr:glycosyltransferase family 2 protein [Ignavibacteriota bacterium]MCB9242132.1 glycosyltransferase family 2 protein [Ignavibacteriales bacterium]
MVSIIIINYNQRDLVSECVKSIENNIHSDYEILIVNNTPEQDLRHLEEIATVIPNANKGFSEANNLAAKEAKGEYLFFLNADTVVKNDSLKGAVEILDKEKVGAVGMKMYNADGTFQLSFWKENTFGNEKINKGSEAKFRQRDKEFIRKIENEHSTVSKVDWVSGAAMLIKKDVFKEIGGFDENFFLFYEDADLCKRLKDKGYKIVFYPGSYITHYKGENVNEEFTGKTYFYAKKSQLLYYEKHNDLRDRVFLRIYLTVKFSFKYLISFKSINLKIFLLTIGLRKSP